jgi:benzoate membrane transport protein
MIARGEEMPMELEPINRPVAGPAAFVRDLSAENAVNALVAFAFSVSGPVAVILAVTARGGLSEAQTASWIFGSFFINGLLSIAFCAAYRQPLVFFWTIPGTVLVGPALAHASFNEVVGAFLVTGLLMLALGLSGVVRRVMDAVPMPIVMGMVAGVFLPFGLDWVKAFETDLAIALSMTLTFLGLSALPNVARRLPPLIVAMAVGVLAIALTRTGTLPPIGAGAILAAPVVVTPHFNPVTLVELVVPLAITVLVVQNGQGIAVLRSAGHAPPINAIAAACGMWSLFAGLVGTVSTCLTGPTNAILAAGRAKGTH